MVLLGIFASCGQKAPPPPPAAFTAEAEVLFGEKTFTAAVQQHTPGVMQLLFTAPKELVGMELALDGGTASLRYRELQVSQSLGTLPKASFAACLNQVLLQLAQPGQEGFTHTAKGWAWKGKVNGLRCSAQIAEDGSLRRLDVPAVRLRIDLKY